MQFISKHLNDNFYLEGDRRISLRDNILFKTIIPLTSKATDQATEDIKRLLEFCRTPRSREEMQNFMKLNHRGNFRKAQNNMLKRN